MCGRYTFFTDKELREVEEIVDKISNDIQRDKMKVGEIFPTNVVPILVPENGIIVSHLMTWGFPNFRNKGVIINARSETVREKRMFHAALENRRCIIPSTGFYEWDKEKKKYLINMAGSSMLYMAGIYTPFDGENRFVILTTNANESISDIHDRMPVVLPKERLEDWVMDDSEVDAILLGVHPDLVKH